MKAGASRQNGKVPEATSTQPVHEAPSLLSADQLLTADQCAVALQLPKSTIEDYARRGVIPSIKLGRHRRFVRSCLDQWLLDEVTKAEEGRPGGAR
jgi:excisionase family DNA binding protein